MGGPPLVAPSRVKVAGSGRNVGEGDLDGRDNTTTCRYKDYEESAACNNCMQ